MSRGADLPLALSLSNVVTPQQAVVLQMAVAAAFGEENYAKLDSLTVSMSPPDSTIALLAGSNEINCVFSVPPFQQQLLEKPGIHAILNSFDVMDGPATFTVAWTTSRFREKNPALYKAGINIGFGSDSGVGLRFPGIAEHRELDLMVEAGLTH